MGKKKNPETPKALTKKGKRLASKAAPGSKLKIRMTKFSNEFKSKAKTRLQKWKEVSLECVSYLLNRLWFKVRMHLGVPFFYINSHKKMTFHFDLRLRKLATTWLTPSVGEIVGLLSVRLSINEFCPQHLLCAKVQLSLVAKVIWFYIFLKNSQWRRLGVTPAWIRISHPQLLTSG